MVFNSGHVKCLTLGDVLAWKRFPSYINQRVCGDFAPLLQLVTNFKHIASDFHTYKILFIQYKLILVLMHSKI